MDQFTTVLWSLAAAVLLAGTDIVAPLTPLLKEWLRNLLLQRLANAAAARKAGTSEGWREWAAGHGEGGLIEMVEAELAHLGETARRDFLARV